MGEEADYLVSCAISGQEPYSYNGGGLGKELAKLQRQHNKVFSTKELKKSGVSFESKNFGEHLIINKGAYHFWPSTGKFRSKDGQSGRGLKNLLKLLKKD